MPDPFEQFSQYYSDIYGSIFGTESQTHEFSGYTPEQQELLKQLSTISGQGIQGLQDPASAMPPLAVGTTPGEQSYLDFLNSRAVQRMAEGGLPYETGPEWAEQYYQESIRPTYLKEYEEITKPGIESAYAGPGYWGSARAKAVGKSSEDLATTLASKRAELMYGEEMMKRQALEAAQGRILPAGQAIATGGVLERDIAHETSMENLQRFLRGEQVEVGGETYQIDPQMGPYAQLALQLLGFMPITSVLEQDPGLLSNIGVNIGV